MNTRISGFAATFILLLGAAGSALAAPVTEAKGSGKIGSLQLIGYYPDDSCTVPMTDGPFSIKHRGLYGCHNDNYYHFKITNGQPGTVITLFDSPNCSNSEPAYRYLITGDKGEELNMTAPRKLEHSGKPGEILEAHLETLDAPHPGRLYGKLSCVSFNQL